MAIQVGPLHTHWNYFLCIEDDLLTLSRWIEFSVLNFSTYSVEIARLLMTCSQEADVLCRQIVQITSPETRTRTIRDYQKPICRAFPRLTENEVYIPRFGLTLTPWDNWSTPENSPFWWDANNSVKHDRANSFHEASLGHVLNAAAGLFVLELVYHSLSGEVRLLPKPALFESQYFGAVDSTSILLTVGPN